MSTEVVKLIGVLTAVFPNHLSADGVRTYARLLADIPLSVLTTAIEQCANDCKFFPAVSEIRDRALLICSPSRLTPSDAWGEVVAQIKVAGFYGKPKFDDPIIERVVFAMDWQTLCSSENPVADRAHFMKMYEQTAEREKHEARLLPATQRMRAEINGNGQRQLSSGDANAAV